MTPVEIRRAGGCAVTLYDAKAVREMHVVRDVRRGAAPYGCRYIVEVSGLGGVAVTREMFDAIKEEIEKL